MKNLLEQIENGIVTRDEVKEQARKEADKLQGFIQRFEMDGGQIKGKGKYCSDLEGYVWSLIRDKFYTFYPYYEDIFMAGMCAIMEVEDRYDPSRGTLTTFFRPYILHDICAWINSNVTFSTQHYAAQEKIINDYLREADLDIEETCDDEIISQTGLPKKTVEQVRVMKQMRRAARIDLVAEPSFAEGQLSAYYYDTPEEYYLKVEEQEELLKKIDSIRQGRYNGCVLTDLERECLVEYYGLDGNAPRKMKMIAEEKGISSYYIRKRLSSAYRKLREAKEAEEENKR